LLLGLAGCGAPQRRAGYVLTQREDLVLSNSPMVTERPGPVVRDGRLEVPYVVLVLNHGKTPATLGPANVQARMDYLPIEARCHGRVDPWSQRELPVEIAPGMELRIECVLRLSDEATRLAAAGDRVIHLTLWPESTSPIRFDYFLSAGASR
jgi:hypothetical protein